MYMQETQIVPYVSPSVDENDNDIPVTSVGLFRKRFSVLAPDEPTAEQIGQLKKWRKRNAIFTGAGMGVVLLALLAAPVGVPVGVVGGLAGWFITKKTLKRREKKVVDRLMAMQYPLLYNEHAVFA